MAYNFNVLQQQLQNLNRQYQELGSTIPQVPPALQQPVPQPVVQQPISAPIPVRQIQYVDGLQGAFIYQNSLTPNSSEIIMDKNDNVFYVVSKDANGTPSRQIPRARFDVEELQQEEPIALTRKDLDNFKEEIRQMIADVQVKPTATTKPTSK